MSAHISYSLIGAKPKTHHEMAAEYYSFDWEYAESPEETSWIASSWVMSSISSRQGHSGFDSFRASCGYTLTASRSATKSRYWATVYRRLMLHIRQTTSPSILSRAVSLVIISCRLISEVSGVSSSQRPQSFSLRSSSCWILQSKSFSIRKTACL